LDGVGGGEGDEVGVEEGFVEVDVVLDGGEAMVGDDADEGVVGELGFGGGADVADEGVDALEGGVGFRVRAIRGSKRRMWGSFLLVG
jgi:hypothetical protein